MSLKKYLFLTDIHYGFERVSGHKVPLHDLDAFHVALAFAQDFKPDVLILGGDILDCAVVSHHNRNKPGRTEGMRLLHDAEGCATEIIQPLLDLKSPDTRYIGGNHEAWLDDLTDDQPGLEGLVDTRTILKLPSRVELIPQGKHTNVGKLTFIHGDQLSGGEHVAKAAVTTWERSIRFGHFHTYQVYTKTSPIHEKLGRTGVAVPCLCGKGPKYGEGKANRWVQGFNYGYVFPDGSYADYTPIITSGRAVVNGKVYRG